MIATPIPDPIPIRMDEHGRWRVGNTNVSLDLVIYSFRNGNTPETITDQYPSLSLGQVYLVLAYYLYHRLEIDNYLREQESQAEAFQREDSMRYPLKLTRDILLERLESKRKQSSS